MNSPKGKYRLKEFMIIGVVFLIMVALSGGYDGYGEWHMNKVLSPNGWIFKQLNNIAEIGIGLTLLYFGHRVINHYRTHELIEKSKNCVFVIMVITSVWILAIAYVIGNALR